jgi:hypothetical protein
MNSSSRFLGVGFALCEVLLDEDGVLKVVGAYEPLVGYRTGLRSVSRIARSAATVYWKT